MQVFFTIVIFLMVCIFRGICSVSDDMNIVMVMAFINAFSFMFVLYIFIKDICDKSKKYLDDIKVYTEDKKKYIKIVNIISYMVILSILGTFGVIYMFKYNETTNDIISIIALGVSIINEDASDGIAKVIFSKVTQKIKDKHNQQTS